MTDADYADDLVVLTNTPTQVKSLWYSLKQIAGIIRIYMNTNKKKTESMCFMKEIAIFTLSAKSLQLVGSFTYLGSNVSSTEIDDKIRIAKVWTVVDYVKIWSVW